MTTTTPAANDHADEQPGEAIVPDAWGLTAEDFAVELEERFVERLAPAVGEHLKAATGWTWLDQPVNFLPVVAFGVKDQHYPGTRVWDLSAEQEAALVAPIATAMAEELRELLADTTQRWCVLQHIPVPGGPN